MKNPIELYDILVGKDPRIERKGKTMPYTSKNGHMFSFLNKDGKMGLRLSEDDRRAFMAKYKTDPMEQHGRIMKEYVEVPDSLLADTESAAVYLQMSFNYVSSLKPKPTKR